MYEEADPGVEGHPAENEVKGVLDSSEGAEDDEVDQPRGEESGVGGVQGFVGGEDREEDSGRDAEVILAIYTVTCEARQHSYELQK